MRIIAAIGAAAGVFALDQLSKFWVLEVLDLRDRLFLEATPFLNFALAYNKGVNFGLFASESAAQAIALAAFAVVAAAVLLVWAARTEDGATALGCGLIAGGALGNALDRIWEGAVVDFLNFDCCGIGNPYSFNIADAGVFLGAALIAWRAFWPAGERAAS